MTDHHPTDGAATPADDPTIAEPATAEQMLDVMLAAGKFKPGEFYDDIPNALYHRGPGVSSSNLKQIARSPAHFRAEKDHPKPQTAAMAFGTAYHTLILEPDLFPSLYVPSDQPELQPLAVPDGAPKRPTKAQINAKAPRDEVLAAADWWAEFDAQVNEHNQAVESITFGKTVISTKPGADPFWSPSDWDRLMLMRDQLFAHPTARCFLQNFIAERSVYWHEPIAVRLDGSEVMINELAKCRYDGICQIHDMAFDLKTAVDSSYSGFTRAIHNFGYHISRQWYMRGAAATDQPIREFVFIPQEKDPPYAAAVYTIDQRFRELADSLIRAYLESYTRCRELGEWPAYPDITRELQTPKYAEYINIS